MGFDIFSSFFCLYGGSIAGLLGLVSTERMKRYFGQSFGDFGESINYNCRDRFSIISLLFLLRLLFYLIFDIVVEIDKLLLKINENNLIKERTTPFNKDKKNYLGGSRIFFIG